MQDSADFRSTLPPYGVLPDGFTPHTAAPEDWRSNTPFQAWLDSSLATISQVLWPVCDLQKQCWTGASVVRMVDLTKADLTILCQVRRRAPDRLISSLPRGPVAHLERHPHKTFYDVEDGVHRFGELHRSYDRTFDKDHLEALPRLFSRGWSRKAPSHITFWFKERLQRPRPFQAAALLGFREFTHEPAKSALHPALISGHTFIGLLGVAGMIEGILADRVQLGADSWAAIEQYAVDVGDRRVMAGVHYPSDNMASWMLALDLCDRVSADARVKQHLWSAISTKSSIYQRMKAAINAGSADAYAPAWAELHRLAPDANT